MTHVLLTQDKAKKKRVSGVVIGAALCCLPGATLGSMYDDWRIRKEAPKLEAAARERQAQRAAHGPPTTRASALPWGEETCVTHTRLFCIDPLLGRAVRSSVTGLYAVCKAYTIHPSMRQS